MTDVREVAAPAQDNALDAIGAFIWYELMTPDPEGSKAFYDAVVGWDIGEGASEYSGYRMINRKDGGFAGGVLPLTAEMQQHGARPTWLGYIYVLDVDQAVGKIEAAGGKALMPATDIPNVGRIAMVTDPQGAPFYVMKPIPPQGDPNAQSDVFSQDKLGTCGWNELSTTDANGALDFYTSQFGWERVTPCRWARRATIASSTAKGRCLERFSLVARARSRMSRRTGATTSAYLRFQPRRPLRNRPAALFASSRWRFPVATTS